MGRICLNKKDIRTITLFWTVIFNKIFETRLKDLEIWILDTAAGQNLISLDNEPNSAKNKGWTEYFIIQVSGLRRIP